MMKTTKEFWARKQFTDSSTMEQWMSSKQQQQQQNNNNVKSNRDELESASVGGKNVFKKIFSNQKKKKSNQNQIQESGKLNKHL